MDTPLNFPYRRSIRLRDYDYRQSGAYFVTICTHQRETLFGTPHTDAIQLTDYGHVVVTEWERTARLRTHVELDAFVVMPNHIHGIIVLVDTDEMFAQAGKARLAPTSDGVRRLSGKPPAKALSSIIGGFKSAVARQINLLRGTPAAPVWQRNYYEHVVRNENDLNMIREYIAANPSRWNADPLFLSTL